MKRHNAANFYYNNNNNNNKQRKNVVWSERRSPRVRGLLPSNTGYALVCNYLYCKASLKPVLNSPPSWAKGGAALALSFQFRPCLTFQPCDAQGRAPLFTRL